jgi:hypothetical protein
MRGCPSALAHRWIKAKRGGRNRNLESFPGNRRNRFGIMESRSDSMKDDQSRLVVIMIFDLDELG